MKAISIGPGTTDVELKDFPEPTIDSPTQVKIKIIEVGLCGKIVKKPTNGHSHLIIGHEMFGQVVVTG